MNAVLGDSSVKICCRGQRVWVGMQGPEFVAIPTPAFEMNFGPYCTSK
jgi:hypothetical protein